ncbi:hypothetical protein [Sorangium sp. So ce128]|uniref:hypothetical protein n=1 Tax=Sorangium sp. So ce128 TaxID=3133281 RepID=UPI003F646617
MRLFSPDRPHNAVEAHAADDGSVLEWALRLVGCVQFADPPTAVSTVDPEAARVVDLVWLPMVKGSDNSMLPGWALRFTAPGKEPELRRLDGLATAALHKTGPMILAGERAPRMPTGFPQPETKHLEALEKARRELRG